MKKFFKTKYGIFLSIYSALLLVILLGCLVRVYTLLVEFETYQPERVVEAQIEKIYNAAKEGTLHEMLPVTENVRGIPGVSDGRYTKSYIDSILNGKLTYSQTQDTFGEGEASFNILSDNKPIVRVDLISKNPRTQMIVFSSADWSLKGMEPIKFNYGKDNFALPGIFSVKLNGKELPGTPDEDGKVHYNINDFGSVDVEVFDIAGNSEKQYGKIKENYKGVTFRVPSSFKVMADGIEVPKKAGAITHLQTLLEVEKFADTITYLDYNICHIPREDGSVPVIEIYDNLGNKLSYNYGDELCVYDNTPEETLPDLYYDVDVMGIAKKWSLFMTNDLAGGLLGISRNLVRESYLYDVAYKWSTGIDHTFTSIHSLKNPPFINERVCNFIIYSENSFSCDIHFTKRMRIANGKEVDDEFSKSLYFVKYDQTNDGVDNPVWLLADMYTVEYENNPEFKVVEYDLSRESEENADE